MYPCLMNCLTDDGLDCIEEGIVCINLIAYHGYKNQPYSTEMWNLFSQLIHACVGSGATKEEQEGGIGFEYIHRVCVTLKNYVAFNPEGMMKTGQS